MQSEFVNISDALEAQLGDQLNPQAEQAAPPSAEAPIEQPVHTQLADLDQRMGKLSSASQKLQAERQAFAEERKQFAAQQAEYARIKQVLDSAKEDPVALAELAGYRPDEYATTLIEKGTLSPERRRILELEKQVQEDRAWRQDFEAKQAQQGQQDLQETVMGQLKQFGQSAGDKYSLVHQMDRYQDVMGVIQQHYMQTMDPETGVGEILPYETAFQAVEDYIDNQLKPVLELQKIKSRFGSAPAELTPETALTNAVAPRKSPSPTVSSRTMRPQTGSPKQLSEHERMQKAGEALFRAMRGNR